MMLRKVGDKVRVKPISWYIHSRDIYGCVEGGHNLFTSPLSEFCGKILTIKEVNTFSYRVEENQFNWEDWMLEKGTVKSQKRKDAPVVKEEKVEIVMEKTNGFTGITKEMSDTYERKNHDYGNSFGHG